MNLGMAKQKRIGKIVYHIGCLILAVIMLYPLLWMIFSSFKETDTVLREASRLLPSKWTLENYVNGWKGFSKITFGTFFKNSFIVASLATFGAVFSSAVIAFGFARIRFPGSNFWFACMMITLMLPFQVVMVPQFLLYTRLGWVGTFLPLIVPYRRVQRLRRVRADHSAADCPGARHLHDFLLHLALGGFHGGVPVPE